MLKQTIALFRYQLIGIINTRLVLVLLILTIAGIALSQFVAELAIINSAEISLALLGEFLRYGLVLLIITTVCAHVSQAYEMAQFERLLSMPIHRWQLILAYSLVVLILSIVLAVTALISFLFFTSMQISLYWFMAVLLELVLAGFIAMLAVYSLEKLPVAILLSLSIYLLAKMVPLFDIALINSAEFFADELTHQFSQMFISLVQYVLPGRIAFAQNNMLFENSVNWLQLFQQFIAVFIYSFFLVLISMVDFYRKEFRA